MLIILLLAIIAAVAVALWWTMSGNKVEVPGVVGLSRAAAVKALENDGFKAGVQEEFSDRVAEGFVSRQAPTSGTKLREGATVDIWVSKGSQKASALPDFKGWTASAVDDWLSQNDLVGVREDGEVEQGRRGPGVQAGPGAGDGAQPRRHGHLLGQQRQAAGDRARPGQPDAGRRRGERWPTPGSLGDRSRRRPARRCRPGSVISQDPAAGEKVDKGSTVSYRRLHRLAVAEPDADAVAERQRGLRAQRVRHAVHGRGTGARRGGLTVAYREKPNTGQQPGTVVKIRPDAGTVVPEGSTVVLVIAS